MWPRPPFEYGSPRQKRMEELVRLLAEKGFNQQKIAERAGVAPSYVSDVKNGKRSMSELFARRLGEEFRFDYRWLLADEDVTGSPQFGQDVVADPSPRLWLPVFANPVQGPPRSLPQWDGTCLEICGPAAARARTAAEPYVLRFQGDDPQARLKPEDLLLVSQAADGRAEVQVIKVRSRMFLVRRLPDGAWERLSHQGPVRGPVEAAGHVLGIVWAAIGPAG